MTGHIEIHGSAGGESSHPTSAQAHIEITGAAGSPTLNFPVSAHGHIELEGRIGIPSLPIRVAFMRALAALAAGPDQTVTIPLPRPVDRGSTDFEVLAVLANAALDQGLSFGYTEGAASFTITRSTAEPPAQAGTSPEEPIEDLAGITDAVDVELTTTGSGAKVVTPERAIQSLNFIVQLLNLIWRIVYGH